MDSGPGTSQRVSRSRERQRERDRDRPPPRRRPSNARPQHGVDLGQQMDGALQEKQEKTTKRKRRGDEEGAYEEAISAKLSGRILKAAREQQREIDAEGELDIYAVAPHALDEEAEEDARAADASSSDDDWNDVYNAAEAEYDPMDEQAIQAFLNPEPSAAGPTSLGDLIMQKLADKQQGGAARHDEGTVAEEDEQPLDEKVVQVYKGVGRLLSRYALGKLPKAFKVVPNLTNWEEVLWLTEPERWSPAATLEATKLFVSNLNSRLAQRFLALVLLPRLREDIRRDQKLHVALFQAVKKAAYKPGAFYKGLILPLCESGTCTLREAFIFSAVLRRTSLPVLHSAAALLRLAQLPYCGTTSFFIRTLLDKKYALPYRVIDALVDHFVQFADDEREMPVVWHQCLLSFVQRYRREIRPSDQAALQKLCQAQHHYQVTPEVLRELHHAGSSQGQAAKANTSHGMNVTPASGGGEVVQSFPLVPLMVDD